MKHTALHQHHSHNKVTWTVRDGWQMPAWFGDVEEEISRTRARVGLADISYLQKIQCCQMQDGAYRLTAKKFLLLGEPTLKASDGSLDVTSVYAAFLLAGPQSRGVLGKLTSLNVSDASLAKGVCRQTSLAHVHATVLRDDIGSMLSYKILVTRDYAEFVWDSILHAGHEFGIVQIGLDAVDRL